MNKMLIFTLLTNGIFFIWGIIMSIYPGNLTIVGYGAVSNIVFDVNNFVLTLLIGIVGVIAIAGLQVLGSGLADATVSLIQEVVVYATLWSALSVFSWGGLSIIPYLGIMLYSLLTVLYAIACVLEMRSD